MSLSNTFTNKMEKKSNVLSVFDFDGTLTYRDSFISFLYFAFGKHYFVKHMTKMAKPTLHFLLRKLTRDELKEILIKTFLTRVDESWFRHYAEEFCKKYWKKFMRPMGLVAIAEEINAGAEVIICSASPELLLEPWADRLRTKLIGTQLEIIDGKFTGRIIGYNCRCVQKITRLKQIYGDLSQYYLRAWGDTCGDYELLAAAQDPHWKHFHPLYERRNLSIKNKISLNIKR